jgi:ubiquinone biosynthesis protein UbiJ
MTPPGKNELKPDVKCVQTMVAVRVGDVWRIADRRAAVEKFLEDNPETAADFEDHRREVRELRREIRQDVAEAREDSGS